MGCWNVSWSEAALSRQEGRQRVLKTQRNRIHLPDISAWGAAPRAGDRASRSAPKTTVPQCHYGHHWDGVGEQEGSCPPWGSRRKTRAGGPSVGKWCHGAPLFPPAPGIFGAFLTALGGLCSLPEHSYGKETAGELEEHTGRSQPHGGTVSMGLFAWKYP